jgi:hypothetical protein
MAPRSIEVTISARWLCNVSAIIYSLLLPLQGAACVSRSYRFRNSPIALTKSYQHLVSIMGQSLMKTPLCTELGSRAILEKTSGADQRSNSVANFGYWTLPVASNFRASGKQFFSVREPRMVISFRVKSRPGNWI